MDIPPGFDYEGLIADFQHIALPFVGVAAAIMTAVIVFKTLKKMKFMG